MREELDPGESETLVLAKELQAELVLLDERAATRRARAIGLTVIGTLGILLLGKRAGFLETIRPSLDMLRRDGFHMSAELYDQVLQSAGEAPSSQPT
jgi:predicted nucleic acid-binding protein